MTFWANSNLILQISHANPFKKSILFRCQYNSPIQDIDKMLLCMVWIFYETDVTLQR